mmetsp:Transcript_87006/g.172724  ORF Transcript_87006/g.172724 Transcript_87006/m.172724 type:complete len:473 (-) Transcript_87006:62-1480(-)
MSFFQISSVPVRITYMDEDEEVIEANGREEETGEVEAILAETGEEEEQRRKFEVGSWKVRASHAPLGNQSTDSGRRAGGAASHAASVKSLPSWQIGQQPTRGRSIFTSTLRLPHFAGNHSDDKGDRGLQPSSQLQVSSRGLAFDANHITGSVPFWSNVSKHNQWMKLQQPIDLIHSRKTLAYLHEFTVSFWVLALFVGAVLVCVCFSGHKFVLSCASRTQSLHNTRPATRESSLCHTTPWSSIGRLSSGKSRALPAERFSEQPTDAQDIQESLPGSSSVSVLLQQSSSLDEGVRFLSKRLVVPPGYESLLYVPIEPKESFHVWDQLGNPMIRVELKAEDDVLREQRRIELMTPDGTPIAVCENVPVPGHGNQIQLFHGNGEYFGSLVPGGREEPWMAWTLRTLSGSEWLFRAHCNSHVMQVTDRQGKILAIAQPTKPLEQHSDVGRMYMVRVTAQVDASIVLASLLAMHHLR